MAFTDFFIKKPATTIVISLAFVILGILHFSKLDLRWVPNITPPVIYIYTSYPGASARLIERTVTEPLEDSLAGVQGLDHVTSHTGQGGSSIRMVFKLGYNLNTAMDDIRSILQNTTSKLPTDVKPPEVVKSDLSGMPIVFVAFSNTSKQPFDLANFVRKFYLTGFQSIPGVSSASMIGENKLAVNILLDPKKLQFFKLTPSDIARAINEQNVEIPNGKITLSGRDYGLTTNQKLNSLMDIEHLSFSTSEQSILTLSEFADVKFQPVNEYNLFRVDGQEAVGLAIYPHHTANPLTIAKKCQAYVQQISKNLPPNIKANIVFDQANFIKHSITEIYKSLFESVILVLIIIIIFLRNFSAACIPIVTIPICLLGTFSVLYGLNVSLNTVSLMALVLAIGLVVDDAIVVLENVYRYKEQGLSSFDAALKGSRQILFPVIAMTVTLAAVYLPIAITPGILGVVFWDFAVTLATSVLISGVVALTLSPMMCAYLLKGSTAKPSRFFNKMIERYSQFLTLFMNKKRYLLIVLMTTSLLGYLAYQALPHLFTPGEDIDIVNVSMSAPKNASADYTKSYLKKFETYLDKQEEVKHYLIDSSSPDSAYIYINLKPRHLRQRSSEMISADIMKQASEFSGVNLVAFPGASPLSWFSRDETSLFSVKIMTTNEFDDLHTVIETIVDKTQKIPLFEHVNPINHSLVADLEIIVDKQRAMLQSVSLPEIANTLAALNGKRKLGELELNGNAYDINLTMDKPLTSATQLLDLSVRNQMNQMINLEDLIQINNKISPTSISHYDKLRMNSISYSINPNFSMGEGIKQISEVMQNLLPANYKFDFSGDAKRYLESGNQAMLTYLLVLLFIYFILVIQFENFIDPITILFTIPPTLSGALMALYLANGSINLYTTIAFVTLIGLIAKHGILITEFANKRVDSGESISSAALSAAKLRLRPILMTTAAMVLGALPLALTHGAGSESRNIVGWTIVGGMIIGTLACIFVVPTVYIFMAHLKRHVGKTFNLARGTSNV